MYVVINGGGKVGSFLAKTLSERGHDVAVIERKEGTLEIIGPELPAAVLIIKGDGCDVRFQEEAGAGHADVFAATTGDDDDNLVSCQIAKTLFHVPRVVARINNPKNESIFHRLGIEAISSTTIISNLIEEEASMGDLVTLRSLKKGKLSLVEVELPTDYCKVCNKSIRELGVPVDCVFVAVIRGDNVLVPRGSTMLHPGDSVIAITSVENEAKLKEALV